MVGKHGSTEFESEFEVWPDLNIHHQTNMPLSVEEYVFDLVRSVVMLIDSSSNSI